jgi:putative acetyltransferase
MPSDVLIEPADVRGAEAVELLARLSRELALRYNDDADDGTANFRPEDVLGPRGGFLVARVDGVAIGCGGFRPWAGDIAEIKRMYVEPAYRGRGVARRLLAELERQARLAGYATVWLETGTAQPEAIRLYETTGYHRIPNYGYYKDHPLSVCFAKDLRG